MRLEVFVPPLRALIVDDEAPARLRIRELLGRTPSVVVAGECASGGEAVLAVRKLQPELLFLDVQMPVMDGFRVLRELGSDHQPLTIFVTAYDRYALAAFEAHALDYLLKPFSDERFAKALERAIAHIELQQCGEITGRMLAMLNSGIRPGQSARPAAKEARLAIRDRGRVVLLKAGEIDWVEAAGVYVELHAGKRVYLHRASITELEAQLGSARFVRIHRSTLVNLDRIRELSPRTHGEFLVLLTDGTELKLSRGYRRHLEEQLGQSL
jgi:two-component system LytT family response regulator